MEITVHPIQNEADYKAALAEVDALMDAEPDTPEGTRLDVLLTLLEAHEARHWAIEAPDPIDAIRVRMEQRNRRQRDLEPMIGSRGRVSDSRSSRAATSPQSRQFGSCG